MEDGTPISSNRGLTEGITENLTGTVMEKLYGKRFDVLEDSGYRKEALIAKQLQMLCPDEFMEQYFVGEGSDKIKAKLEQYYIGDSTWGEEIESLFDRIEDGFLLRQSEREEDFKSGIPSSVQHTLLSALDRKLEQDIESGKINNREDVEEYMEIYGKNILTAENLNLNENRQKKFPGLQNVSDRFESIKDKYKQRIILKERQQVGIEGYIEEINEENLERDGKVNSQKEQVILTGKNITTSEIEQATEDVSISNINNETKIADKIIESPTIETPIKDAPVIE